MGALKKEIFPAIQTAGGALATAFGQPEIGIPLMVGGISQGVGSGVGGGLGKDIALGGSLASIAGGGLAGMSGAGMGATADAASAAGRMPSTDVMQSAMGPAGPSGGISAAAPLLQKYGPLLAKAGIALPNQPGQPQQQPPPPSTTPPAMARPQAAAPPSPAVAGAPPTKSPGESLRDYRNFLSQGAM